MYLILTGLNKTGLNIQQRNVATNIEAALKEISIIALYSKPQINKEIIITSTQLNNNDPVMKEN